MQSLLFNSIQLRERFEIPVKSKAACPFNDSLGRSSQLVWQDCIRPSISKSVSRDQTVKYVYPVLAFERGDNYWQVGAVQHRWQLVARDTLDEKRSSCASIKRYFISCSVQLRWHPIVDCWRRWHVSPFLVRRMSNKNHWTYLTVRLFRPGQILL